MSDPIETKPLDLAIFDDLDPAPANLPATVANTAVDPRLAPEPAPPRLVEIGSLSPEDRAHAEQSAAQIDFRKTATLLSHGDGVLAEIAQSSRQLLTGVRLGDAGEVGRIAASVIDGVKILRIEDLQAEAAGGQPAARKGLLGRLMGVAADAHTAFKGFAESRKKFLDLMDERAGQGPQDQGRPGRLHRAAGPAGRRHPPQPARPEDRDRRRPDRARPRPGGAGAAAPERRPHRRCRRRRRRAASSAAPSPTSAARSPRCGRTWSARPC